MFNDDGCLLFFQLFYILIQLTTAAGLNNVTHHVCINSLNRFEPYPPYVHLHWYICSTVYTSEFLHVSNLSPLGSCQPCHTAFYVLMHRSNYQQNVWLKAKTLRERFMWGMSSCPPFSIQQALYINFNFKTSLSFKIGCRYELFFSFDKQISSRSLPNPYSLNIIYLNVYFFQSFSYKQA